MVVTSRGAVNYWPDAKCAKAFWGQHEAPAYQELLLDTASWLCPAGGQDWLDLGCGCGQLSAALWQKSGGSLSSVVAVDCAPTNSQAIERLARALDPRPRADQLRFACVDFSEGLPAWDNNTLDGVVSGLAIQYAESYCPVEGRWTRRAYDHLLAEVFRVLRPGGTFVFSVNVPDPAWSKVAWRSLGGVWRTRRPARYLKKAWRMLRYGSWLKREARRGRFHFLPAGSVTEALAGTGFVSIRHRVSYAGQAYVFAAQKPR